MEKILFCLDVEDDYPPVSKESVWGEKLPSGNYKIKNIPFYTKEVSFDDEVTVSKGEDGELLFNAVIENSGNSTIRVIFLEKEDSKIMDFKNKMVALGCEWEEFSKSFFSVNIPPETDLDVVIDIMAAWSKKGLLEYEYGFLGQ